MIKDAYFLQTVKPSKSDIAKFEEYSFEDENKVDFQNLKTPAGGKEATWKFAGVPDQQFLIAYRHVGNRSKSGYNGITDAFLLETDDDFDHAQKDFRIKGRFERILLTGTGIATTRNRPFYMLRGHVVEQLAILDLQMIHFKKFGIQHSDADAGQSFVWLKQALDAAKIAEDF